MPDHSQKRSRTARVHTVTTKLSLIGRVTLSDTGRIVLQPPVSRIGRTWRFGVPSGSPQAFLWAIACVATATAVTAAVDLFRPDILTHAAYYPATLFATLIGGAASGLFAMTLGAVIAWWIFKPPYLGLIAAEHTNLALYVVSSLIIIWAAQRYRRLVRKLERRSAIGVWSWRSSGIG
jgi:hypothetical protein